MVEAPEPKEGLGLPVPIRGMPAVWGAGERARGSLCAAAHPPSCALSGGGLHAARSSVGMMRLPGGPPRTLLTGYRQRLGKGEGGRGGVLLLFKTLSFV